MSWSVERGNCVVSEKDDFEEARKIARIECKEYKEKVIIRGEHIMEAGYYLYIKASRTARWYGIKDKDIDMWRGCSCRFDKKEVDKEVEEIERSRTVR